MNARLPFRDANELPDDARAVFGALERERGYVPFLYQAAANAPRFLPLFHEFVSEARTPGALPESLREVAVLTIARVAGCQTMAVSHRAPARNAGLDDAKIAAISAGNFDAVTPLERAVIAFAEEVTTSVRPRDATWDALAAHLEAEALADLTFLVAFYNMVARVAETLSVPLDPRYDQA